MISGRIISKNGKKVKKFKMMLMLINAGVHGGICRNCCSDVGDSAGDINSIVTE